VAAIISSKPKDKKSNRGDNKDDQIKKIEKKKNANCHEKGHYVWECLTKPKKKPKNDSGSTSGSASNGSGAACAFAFSAMFEQEKITEDDSWFFDSCASLHFTFHREWIKNYCEGISKHIKMGNNEICPVKGYGYVDILSVGKYRKKVKKRVLKTYFI